jgi:hypothetical protein
MGLLLWRWFLRWFLHRLFSDGGFVSFHLRKVFVAAVYQLAIDVLLWPAHFLIP